jgi:hypothetical protein
MFKWRYHQRKVDTICLELFRAGGMRIVAPIVPSASRPNAVLRLGIFDSDLFKDEPLVYCELDSDEHIIPGWYVRTYSRQTLPASIPERIRDLVSNLLTETQFIERIRYKMFDSTHHEISKSIDEMVVLHKLSN